MHRPLRPSCATVPRTSFNGAHITPPVLRHSCAVALLPFGTDVTVIGGIQHSDAALADSAWGQLLS